MNNSPSPARALAVVLVAVLGGSLIACEERKAVRMEIDPEGPIIFDKRSAKVDVHLAFFDANDRRFVRKAKAVFDAVDSSVVKVVTDKGGGFATLSPTKSGRTTVNVEAFGLKGSVEVRALFVGKVVVDKTTPKELTLGGKPFKLNVAVEDDRGNPMKDVPLHFDTSDHCITADPDGTITPVAQGECEVVVSAAGVFGRHAFVVQ